MRKTTTDLGDEEELDEIERDQRERKEFEERLKKRDEAKTKNVAIAGMSRAEIEEVQMRQRVAESNEEEKNRKLEELRKTSRIKYLKDRELKKWNELEADLADEDELFSGVELSKFEKERHKINRTIYEATKQQRALSEVEYHGYTVPEAEFDKEGKLDQKREMDKLKARYTRHENEKELLSFGTQEWENEQMGKHQFAFGAKKHIPKPNEVKKEEFGLVLDDTIDFITEDIIAGDIEEGEGDAEERAKQQAHSLQDVRKSLPIFEYRETLLEAIEKYQVLVVQGMWFCNYIF